MYPVQKRPSSRPGSSAMTKEPEAISQQKSPAVIVADFLRAVTVPGSTFQTLQVFLEALEEDGKLIIGELVRRTTGAAVTELLKDAIKLKAVDIALIFQVLEKIVFVIVSDLQAFESFALELAENLITKHLRTFYYMLKTNNKSNQIKSAIKLLIVMCTLGNKTVKLLVSQFSFLSCNFGNLVTRRNTMDPQDIRASTIHFIVAILMFGDIGSVRALLQTKNSMSALFPGLIVDRSEVIQILLSTLLDKVVKNMAISKTLKIQLFNQTALKQLSKVLSWNGHKKSEKMFVEDEVVASITDEERLSVRDSVLQFLTVVCASQKFGIVFQDPSIGTGSKNFNHVLTDLLRTLTFASPYHRDLVYSILLAAPDQMTHFLATWKSGFVPRVSEKWTQMMSWFAKLLDDMDVTGKLSNTPAKSRVPAALALLLPAFFDKELQTDAFAEAQPMTVPLTMLSFLSEVLIRARKLMVLLNDQEKEEFQTEILTRIVEPDIIQTCLRKRLEKSEDVRGKAVVKEEIPLSEEILSRFHLFFALDHLVLSKRPQVPKLENNLDGNICAVSTGNQAATLLSDAEKDARSKLTKQPGNQSLDIAKIEKLRKVHKGREASKELRTNTSYLLLELVQENPKIFTAAFLDLVASSYTATLSVADQTLFQILCLGDQGGHSQNSSFALFGKLAQRHQQLREKQGVSVFYQPTLREFVDALEPGILAKTASHFPIRLSLTGDLLNTELDDSLIYDPRYLLSTFSSLLSAGQVNITHFVESGCLGVVVAALGSLDGAMRAAAWYFLREFTTQARKLRFKGRDQLLYVLDLIRRGSRTEKAWPSLWTGFLNRFFTVMMDSQNHVYQIVMEFLLVKPSLSLDSSPEFLKFFESSTLSHAKERRFALEVLRDGIKHFQDYDICRRSRVYELILPMYGSPLSNKAHNLLISEILLQSSIVPFVGRALVKNQGLFTWMTYHLESSESDVEAVGNLIRCAWNCFQDLLSTKRGSTSKSRLSAHLLLRSLLVAVDGCRSLEVTGSVLRFLHAIIASGEVELRSEDVILAVDLGMKYLEDIRPHMDGLHWRDRCLKVAPVLLALNSFKTPALIILRKFISLVVGVDPGLDLD